MEERDTTIKAKGRERSGMRENRKERKYDERE